LVRTKLTADQWVPVGENQADSWSVSTCWWEPSWQLISEYLLVRTKLTADQWEPVGENQAASWCARI
jgi:hypothetical protein